MTSLPAPPDFKNETKSDVVLRSIDLCDFPFRRLYLSAASQVFEDMFEGIEGSTGLRNAQGLPIIQLQETARELELFLRFIHREMSLPKLATLSNVTILLRLGDKYQSNLVLSFGTTYLRDHVHTDPLGIFKVAVRYRNQEIARLAMKQFHRVDNAVVNNRRRSRSLSLGAFSVEELSHFSILAIKTYAKVHDLVRHNDGQTEWSEEADAFEL